MADDACCGSFGGRITIEVDGELLSARGDITIDPVDLDITADTNQDGSAYYTNKPALFGGEATFTEPCKGTWRARMVKCKVNITVVEEDNARQHLFTSTRLIGRPRLNVSTGELSGVTWAGGAYRMVAI